MKPTEGVRALVLAAGLGTRLRPLTLQVPKPILPIAGEPLLVHGLRRLARAGIREAAVNLHHLHGRIPESLRGEPRLPVLVYSFEEELLGTLGALHPLRGFFSDCRAILVVNGDTLCRWPVRKLLRLHHRRGAALTLLLTRRPDPDRYGGGVGIDAEGRLVSVGPEHGVEGVAHRRVFAGAQVLDPRLLERVPEGPAEAVSDLWLPLLGEGLSISTLSTGRAWYDLGTPRRYLRGALAWARPWYRWPDRWIHPESTVGPGARLRGVVVERGARVEPGARLESCVVMPGARVARRSRLDRTIVGPGTEIPERTRITERLVTRERTGEPAPARSSRLGDLWYTPLDPPG
ncbi:MAG: NDP-sugar synthase [Thermoanaerobaculia bacterium]|nr:NDP-sugar synthase [Thermoanaerobaculia bacterium]